MHMLSKHATVNSPGQYKADAHSKQQEVITVQKSALIHSKRLLHFNSNYNPLKQAKSLRAPDLCQTGPVLLFRL